MSRSDELRCLDESPECEGLVRWHSIGQSLKAWPRCRFHIDRRVHRYESSIERYADSDVPPAWFDPLDAGERWDE